ncbi:MAG: hypothetical protein M3478_12095, partial [Planctomycetota bacterium]|nr:hypothetical protein [Planctomycetota bacterium]
MQRAPGRLAQLTMFTALGIAAVFATIAISAQDRAPADEARAVGFLVREVPKWKTENDCYSCHNNGDAARALILA